MTITKLSENEVFNQMISDEELQYISGGRIDVQTDDNDERLTYCTVNQHVPPFIALARDLMK